LEALPSTITDGARLFLHLVFDITTKNLDANRIINKEKPLSIAN